MTEMNQDNARTEALRRVVERVTAWQETATDGTIHEELDRGLREAGVTLTDEQRDRVTEQISSGQEVDVDALGEDGVGDGPA
jgi:uncharacterized protein YpuA (DUF1002 family)